MLTTDGAKIMLGWYFKKQGPSNPQNRDNSYQVLRLYTNDVTPTELSKKSDFKEAVGGGYLAKTLSAATWTVTTVDNISQAAQEAQLFTFIGELTIPVGVAGIGCTKSIYGWWIEDGLGNFIGAHKMPYVYTPDGSINSYEITPIFRLGHPFS